ncbi:MAG: Gfo/Idh/MocA family oxidoreductase [Caldilineaceae bacterium]
MAKTLRWGLLSTARINQAVIGPIRNAWRAASWWPWPAGCARPSLPRNGTSPRVHGSYEALLADPDVDVIYNPLPNTMHAEWTIKAAAAGKHVLCEKAVVTTLDDLDRVETAAAQRRHHLRGVHVSAPSPDAPAAETAHCRRCAGRGANGQQFHFTCRPSAAATSGSTGNWAAAHSGTWASIPTARPLW